MRLAAVALSFFLAACSHATKVAKQDSGGDEEQKAAAQPTEKEGGAAEKPSVARRPRRPGAPPLAASPSGLFAPGGVAKVQKALADRGYLDLSKADKGEVDDETAAAIRKFQSDQGIARTGNPDHETVRRLGLDPDELFRKSEAKKSR